MLAKFSPARATAEFQEQIMQTQQGLKFADLPPTAAVDATVFTSVFFLSGFSPIFGSAEFK